MILEPVAGSTGVLIPPKGYLNRIREVKVKKGQFLACSISAIRGDASDVDYDKISQLGTGEERIPLLSEALELFRGGPSTLLIDMDEPGIIPVESDLAGGEERDRLRQELVLDLVDSLLELGAVARGRNLHGSLEHDGPRVHSLVDEVHGDAGHPDAVRERLADRVEPRKGR